MERLTLRDDDGRAIFTPYGLQIYCSTQATADCICKLEEALKAQVPRVLALDEIHRGMAVWLEDVDKADVILAIGGSSAGRAKCFITENDISIAPKDAEYGIRWRAWTAEPTEEQRKEVKWGA